MLVRDLLEQSSPAAPMVSTSNTAPACETTPDPAASVRTRGYSPVESRTRKVLLPRDDHGPRQARSLQVRSTFRYYAIEANYEPNPGDVLGEGVDELIDPVFHVQPNDIAAPTAGVGDPATVRPASPRPGTSYRLPGRDHRAPGAGEVGEVGEVVGPDPVGFPLQPVRPRRPRGGVPGGLTRYDQAISGQHPGHGGLRDMHHAQPGATGVGAASEARGSSLSARGGDVAGGPGASELVEAAREPRALPGGAGIPGPLHRGDRLGLVTCGGGSLGSWGSWRSCSTTTCNGTTQ